MKKILLTLILFATIATYNNAQAQRINISVNINSQPAWGPVGYDYARYYYLPDIDCYYDINMSLFYFMDRGVWVSARYLPYAYRNYNLYHMYKVVLNDYDPWRYHSNHYRTYGRYKGNYSQVMIYNSNDRRYNSSRQNRVNWIAPEHRSDRNRNSGRNNQQRDYSRSQSGTQNRQQSNNQNNNDRMNNNRRETNRQPQSNGQQSSNRQPQPNGQQSSGRNNNANSNRNNSRTTTVSNNSSRSSTSSTNRRSSDSRQNAAQVQTSRR